MFPVGLDRLVPAFWWLAVSMVHSAATSSQLCQTQQPGAWPVHSCSIPEGSSVQIPISISGSIIVVCKINSSTSDCDSILVLNSQKLWYFNSSFEGHIALSDKHFTVKKMSKWLKGNYLIKLSKDLDGAATACVNLTVADPIPFLPSTPGSPQATERHDNGTAESKISDPATSTHSVYLALLAVPFVVAIGWVLWKKVRRHFVGLNQQQQVSEEPAQVNGPAGTREHGHASELLYLNGQEHIDDQGHTSVPVHTNGHIHPIAVVSNLFTPKITF